MHVFSRSSYFRGFLNFSFRGRAGFSFFMYSILDFRGHLIFAVVGFGHRATGTEGDEYNFVSYFFRGL